MDPGTAAIAGPEIDHVPRFAFHKAELEAVFVSLDRVTAATIRHGDTLRQRGAYRFGDGVGDGRRCGVSHRRRPSLSLRAQSSQGMGAPGRGVLG